MRLGAIEILSVPVTDQQRAKEFYEETLGFKLISDASFGEGMRWVQLEPPGGGTNITLVTWFEDVRPGSLRGMVIACDDVDAAYEELRGRGARFGGPPEDMAWGRFASLQDPDGNGWLLRQPLGASALHGAHREALHEAVEEEVVDQRDRDRDDHRRRHQ
jgi:predicted enzyme related to lactoylglutathione lyase